MRAIVKPLFVQRGDSRVRKSVIGQWKYRPFFILALGFALSIGLSRMIQLPPVYAGTGTLTAEGDNQPENQPTLVRHPYLQNLSTDTVTIVWTTTESGPSEVHYSTDLSYSNVVTATSTFKAVDAPVPYDRYHEHVAVLSDLATNTTYNYAIYTQGTRLAANTQLHFRTHLSSSNCTFDFAFFGDTRLAMQGTFDLRDQMVARGFDFGIDGGDLVSNGTYEELETEFFNVFQDILSNQMIWPALGNHDYYYDPIEDEYYCDPYLDVFHLPEQALYFGENERYYSFDFGNAHFVILDTNPPLWRVQDWIVDDMADWLERDLAADDSFWTVVAMHHPWYVSCDRWHYEKVRDSLVPLFEEYDVDIVLTGHDHLYERTFPIKDDALSTVEVGGVIYVTNGEGGGVDAPYPWVEPAPHWSAARSNHTYEGYGGSYTHIHIDNGVMSLITIDDQGNVIDPAGSTDPLVIIDRSNEPGASCTAGITGTVYEDTDGGGAFSAGDTPLAGVQIDLSDGQSTTTNVSGTYTFTGLLPGSYTVTEIDPSGYLSSGDVQGANDNTITVTLQSGELVTGRDFFDYRPAGITGTVYEDTDGDGAFSAGDTPLAGVQIDLSDGQSTTTNVSGTYTFTGLLPGSYTVTECDPPGYHSVADVQGANDNLISIALASGSYIVEQNFLDTRQRILIFLPIVSRISTN